MNKNLVSDDEIGKVLIKIPELKEMAVSKVHWVKLTRKDGKSGGEVAIEIVQNSHHP